MMRLTIRNDKGTIELYEWCGKPMLVVKENDNKEIEFIGPSAEVELTKESIKALYNLLDFALDFLAPLHSGQDSV